MPRDHLQMIYDSSFYTPNRQTEVQSEVMRTPGIAFQKLRLRNGGRWSNFRSILIRHYWASQPAREKCVR